MKSVRFIIILFFSFLVSAIPGYGQESDPVGDYLLKGGVGLISIVRDASGELVGKDYYFVDDEETGTLEIEYVAPQIFLTFTYNMASLPKENRQIFMQFLPSRDTSGNWDLVFVENRMFLSGSRQPSTKKVDSFLHRVDDGKINKYFEITNKFGHLENKELAKKRLLTLARRIVADHPDDKAVRTLYFDALLRNRGREELAQAVEKWSSDYRDDDSYPSILFDRVQQGLHALNLSHEGRNAYDLLQELYEDSDGMQQIKDQLPKVISYEQYRRPVECLIPNWTVPNYFSLQTGSKVMGVEAKLLSLQGKRDQARNLLLAEAHIGTIMQRDGELIEFLISLAVQGIAYRPLRFFVENCSMSPVYLDPIREQLDRCLERTGPINENDVRRIYSFRMSDAGERISYAAQVVVRNNVAVAQLQNLRTVTAAKLYQVNNGELPDSTAEIAPLFPSRFPQDPFGDDIQYRRVPDGCIAYSIGPDRSDNSGGLEYDPTNGTVSAGDVICPMSETPRYPIPAWGVRADSVQDLLSQFPNGLPLDPFNSNGTAPLTVRETDKVYVYSFGPDNQDTWFQRGRTNLKEPLAYDPTNGTTSEGDIFFIVPKR